MICFHHDDLDGRCSAAIVQRHLFEPCIVAKGEFVEINYTTEFPLDKIDGKHVILLDYTPSTREVFDAILKRARMVTWVDHHELNIAKYPDIDEKLRGLRSKTWPSAAVLSWNFFAVGNHKPPLSVALVSDYDSWKHDYPDSKAFHAGMDTVDQSPMSSIWDQLLQVCEHSPFAAATEKIIERGKVVLDYMKHWNADYIRTYGFATVFEGYKAFACGIGRCGLPFFDSVDDYDLFLGFEYTGEVHEISVYSRNEKINCADLAKQFGGGGHPGAAGFSCKDLPF